MAPAVRAVTSIRSRLHIGRAGLLALAVALAVTGLGALVLAAAGEDVVTRDGMALHDPSRLQLVVDHRSTLLEAASRWFTTAGDVGVLIPIAIIVGLLLWFRGARLIVALAPVLALGTAGAIAGVLKVAVARSRPPTALHLVAESGFSFPSGHSSDSAALYLTIGLVVAVVFLHRPLGRALVVGVAAALVFAIGMSRLVLGVHYPSDVLAGWALGLVVAVVVSTVVLTAHHLAATGPPEPRSSPELWRTRIHTMLIRERRHLSSPA